MSPAHRLLLALCVASFALGLSLGSTGEHSPMVGATRSAPVLARGAAAPDPGSPQATTSPAADPARVPTSPGTGESGTVEGAERRAGGTVTARTQATSEGGAIEQAIRAAALEFGVDQDALLRVAACESHLDPLAIGAADELGILQFRPKTFRANARTLGYTLADILDVRAQARVAAEMWSRGQQWQWTCAR